MEYEDVAGEGGCQAADPRQRQIREEAVQPDHRLAHDHTQVDKAHTQPPRRVSDESALRLHILPHFILPSLGCHGEGCLPAPWLLVVDDGLPLRVLVGQLALGIALGDEEIAHETHHAAPAVLLVDLEALVPASVDPVRARAAHDIHRALELVCVPALELRHGYSVPSISCIPSAASRIPALYARRMASSRAGKSCSRTRSSPLRSPSPLLNPTKAQSMWTSADSPIGLSPSTSSNFLM